MDLLSCMRRDGYTLAVLPKLGGGFTRFPVGNKADGNRDGYCKYVESDRVCIYGDWVSGNKYHWFSDGAKPTANEERLIHEAEKQAEQERQKEAIFSAKTAIDKAEPVTAHAYLAEKRVQPHGVLCDRGTLLIPLRDIDGNLRSIQKIWRGKDGGFIKGFWGGCGVSGAFFSFGDIGSGDTLIIAEGFATAATIYEAINIPVVAAMSAGNLSPVLAALRGKYPDLDIIIAADDDCFSDGKNTGIDEANKAAGLHGGRVIIPDFSGTERDKGTDFNDLFKSLGYDKALLKTRISQAIEAGKTAKENNPAKENNLFGCCVPAGYHVDNTGLYQTNENGELTRIGDALWVVGSCADSDGEKASTLIEFITKWGERKRLIIPSKDFASRDGVSVLARLYDASFNIVKSKARSVLLDYLISAKPKDDYLLTKKTGWHDDKYVLPDAVFGGGGVIYTGTGVNGFSVSGTLADWQQHISAKAKGNSRLGFAISASFASPLLKFTGVQTTGFHFYGASSKGKSTIHQAANSVYGSGALISQWEATANGIEELVLERSGTLLCLDELSQATPKMIYNVAFRVANQRTKKRNSLSKYANDGSWQLLYLSNGELSVMQFLKSDGLRVKAGQTVRLIDIPACHDDDKGAFEKTNGDSKRFVDDLKAAVNLYHGTAIRAFLDAIAKPETLARLKADASQKVKEIAEQLRNGRDFGDQARRIVEAFAVVVYGGQLATELGITGWDKNEAFNAVKYCLDDCLAERGMQDCEEMQVISAFVDFIHEHPEKIADGRSPDVGLKKDIAGYYFIEAGRKRYAFTDKGFQTVIGDIQKQHALKILDSKGVLMKESERLSKRETVMSIGSQARYRVINDNIFKVHEAMKRWD